MVIYVSEYDAMTQIFPDISQRTCRKEFYHIQSKYKVLKIINDTHHWKYNLAETHIHFYKNAKNDILYLTGDTSYMQQYAFLTWVDTYNFMGEHAHGGYFAYEDIFNTTPELIQYTHYTLW